MSKNARHICLSLLLLSAIVRADPAVTDASKRLQLATQKAKLVETLMNTPAMKAAPESRNAEVAAWAINSRLLLDQARSAISMDRPDEAIEKLDEALRSLSRSSSMLTSDTNGMAAQRRQFDEHASQIESYRRALQDMAGNPSTANVARQTLSRLDQMTGEGRKLQESGKLEEANARMAAAYKFAVAEISRLREGQEVVLRLQFATPREEFLYEQKRFHSNEIMVGMMSKEERVSSETRKQVETYFNAAVDLKNEANSKASGNDYPAAVKDMEKAIIQLNRALQVMGVPVF
ncbi:MAG: hypothetical protein H6R14_324 [Proteobacteria bacterium]|nr:hypothetical protein [Pseudomonadota bacterium]